MDPSSRAARLLQSNVAGAVVALALAALLAFAAWSALPRQLGIDFYQFWGVPVAKEAAATRSTPYVDPAAYANVLNAISDASQSARLRGANRYRRNLEPMGTPFLYASFAAFPRDYDRALELFGMLQYLAAGVAVYLLARLRGVGRWPSAWIALLVELTFAPFLQDVRVGNVNSLQLLVVVALLHVAARRRYSGNALVDGLFLGVLGVFVVFKPNTPWIALALGIHYWVVHGHRRFFIGAGLAAALGAAALTVGAWYFEDAGAWMKWLDFARGMDGSAIALTLAQGNLSLGMLLAQRSMAYGPMGFGILIAGALSVALLLAASAGGRRGALAMPALRAAFSDPWFAASVGVVFTLATSPLVWPHYLMLALIPIFWLAGAGSRVDAGTVGAVACYVLLSLPLMSLMGGAGLYGAIQAGLLVSWVALVPGVFAHAARHNRLLQGGA